jgi:hypothetical protein
MNTQTATVEFYSQKIILTKLEDGKIYDQHGKEATIKKHEWLSDHGALYIEGYTDSLLKWQELPDSVQALFYKK